MGSAVAKRSTEKMKVVLGNDKMQEAMASVLPRHLTPDRMTKLAIRAEMRSPDLGKCTPESIINCMMDLSTFGLEPDGQRAHLIPFKNNRNNTYECTLIIGYQGLADRIRRSGEVSSLHCDVVRERDVFSYAYGSDSHLRHVPALSNRGDRIAAYSHVKLKDGSEDFRVFDMDYIESVRERSRGKSSGPWSNPKSFDYDEMIKKTALRNHSKWLPFSAEVRGVIERDDDQFDFSTARSVAATVENANSGARIAFGKQKPEPEAETSDDGDAPTTAEMLLKIAGLAPSTFDGIVGELGFEGISHPDDLSDEQVAQVYAAIDAGGE